MKKAILATKVGMTQIFNEDGVLTPVTVLQAGPCVVTQVKTMDNDGYGRYSGEVQLVRSDLPADSRVNVVGQVETPWLLLADCVRRGEQFVLTRD